MISRMSPLVSLAVCMCLVWSAAACQPKIDPSPTPSISQTPESSQPGQTPAVSQVLVFFVALEDAGRAGKMIGCNDSVVGLSMQVDPTTEPLQTALVMLLSEEQLGFGKAAGLYNSLQSSSLQVVEATIDEEGTAHIQLSGQLLLGGMCDDPRVKAQLEETIFQFPEVTSAEIMINGKPFEQYFQIGP